MNPAARLDAMDRITSYQAATEVVMSKYVLQAKEGELQFMPLKSDTLTILHGRPHAERRRMENPLFARPHLRRYEGDILDAALDEQLLELASQNRESEILRTDLLTLVGSALLRVTAALVGLDPPGDAKWWQELSLFVDVLAMSSAIQWKEGDIEDDRALVEDYAKRFSAEIFEPAWARRVQLVEQFERGERNADTLPSDLITTLLLHLPGRSRDVVLRESILFFAASSETTTYSVATTVLRLSEWFAKHPEDRPHARDIAFLQAAGFEAIRLHSIAGLVRAPTVDLTLSTGERLEAGREVFIDVRAVNRDMTIFGDDASDFSPGRSLPTGVKPYGFGFGGGAHKCIGLPLAMSHDAATDETTPDQSIGSLVRTLHRLYEFGVELDPERPPVRRVGWRQERYLQFPIVLTKVASLREGVK